MTEKNFCGTLLLFTKIKGSSILNIVCLLRFAGRTVAIIITVDLYYIRIPRIDNNSPLAFGMVFS